MENKELIVKTEFRDIVLDIIPHEEYEWLLSTAEVTKGYEISESTVRDHKRNNSTELLLGEHFVPVENIDRKGYKRKRTYWTKEGVIYLGFFIKSERAKIFRKWASKLILNYIEKKEEEYVTKAFLEEFTKQNNKLLKLIMLDI